MAIKFIAALLGILFATGGLAAVGEPGGAYGGTTSGVTEPLKFGEVDRNEDGKVTLEEARAAGIERFEQGDSDNDGTLDKAEFAAMEPLRQESTDQPPTAED